MGLTDDLAQRLCVRRPGHDGRHRADVMEWYDLMCGATHPSAPDHICMRLADHLVDGAAPDYVRTEIDPSQPLDLRLKIVLLDHQEALAERRRWGKDTATEANGWRHPDESDIYDTTIERLKTEVTRWWT